LAQADPGAYTEAGDLQKRYGKKTTIRDFDTVATQVTEMDALIAYLQVLGRLTGSAYHNPDAPRGGGVSDASQP